MKSVSAEGHVNLAVLCKKRDVNGNSRWRYIFMYVEGGHQTNYTKYMKGIGTFSNGTIISTLSPPEVVDYLTAIDGSRMLKVFSDMKDLYKKIDKCKASIDRRGSITCKECSEYLTCPLALALSLKREEWVKANAVCESLKTGFIHLPQF